MVISHLMLSHISPKQSIIPYDTVLCFKTYIYISGLMGLINYVINGISALIMVIND